MTLLTDIGLDVAQGALRGALHPFAAAGDITSAQADTISAGAVDLFKLLGTFKTNPPAHFVQAELRALFDPLVTNGNLTGAKADEITAALVDSVGLGEKLMAAPKAATA
jgi:hypothetical protein